MWTVRSGSEADTLALGRALGEAARAVGGGLVVALTGDLGAGKTRLARGAGEALAVGDEVTSPTFVLVAEHEGELPLLHADAYRLGPGEAEDIGLAEALDAAPGLALVEWADRVPDALPEDHLRVRIEFDGADGRRLHAEATGPRSRALLAAWRERWAG